MHDIILYICIHAVRVKSLYIYASSNIRTLNKDCAISITKYTNYSCELIF